MNKAKSIRDNKKVRGRPKTTGSGQLIGVRIQPDMLDALDKFQTENSAPSRPEAVRLILRDSLIGLGLLQEVT